MENERMALSKNSKLTEARPKSAERQNVQNRDVAKNKRETATYHIYVSKPIT